MSGKINKILVAGGTGMLGRPVVRRLLKDDYKVRLMSHRPERAELFFGDEVEKVFGDVTDYDTLPNAIKGCDAVYINLGSKLDLDQYVSIEQEGTANLARAAAEAGIERIAMISGLNVNEFDTRYRHIGCKLKAEESLMNSGIPYTIFRCGWFFESLPLYMQGKKAMLIGDQPLPRGWMAVSDYAGMVSRAFGLTNTTNKIFYIRGSEKMTMPAALAKFCDLVAPDATISAVPLWMVRLGALFSRRSKMKGLVDFMGYFDKHPDPDVNDEAQKILGPTDTTMEEWAAEYKNRLQLINK